MITTLRCFCYINQLNRNSVYMGNAVLQRIQHYQGETKRYKSDKSKDDNSSNTELPMKKCDIANSSMYRCEKDTIPSNYDPYRIKVPEIQVPPLPPSNAQAFMHGTCSGLFQDAAGKQCTTTLTELFNCCPVVHPDYWKGKVKSVKNKYCFPSTKLGYHGKTKFKFAFHEPWRPLDRVSLLAQAERAEDDALPDSDKKQAQTQIEKA